MKRTGVAITILWRNEKDVLGVDADPDVLGRLALLRPPDGEWLSWHSEPCMWWYDSEETLRAILGVTGPDTRLDTELYIRYPWLAEEMRG